MWLFVVVVMVLKVLLLCYKYDIYIIYIYIYFCFYCFRSVNGLFEMNGFQNSFHELFTSSDNCSTSGRPGWLAENNIMSRGGKNDLGNDF